MNAKKISVGSKIIVSGRYCSDAKSIVADGFSGRAGLVERMDGYDALVDFGGNDQVWLNVCRLVAA